MRLSPSRLLRMRLYLAALVWIPVSLGCGSSHKGTVSGKVSYREGDKTTMLKGGMVTFVIAGGTSSLVSPIAEDGSYSIENVPAGPVKIVVETSSLARKASLPAYSPPPGQAQAKGGHASVDPAEAARRYVPIPAKYEKLETTPLEFTAKGGKETHNIELEGFPPPASP
jgi:hypothetical protein